MVRVAILPIATAAGTIAYRAVAGDRYSEGRTAGEALDTLMEQLPEDERTALSVVQFLPPDRFFGADKLARLAELMDRWREARDRGTELSRLDQAELDALIEEELRAAGRRSAALLTDLPQ